MSSRIIVNSGKTFDPINPKPSDVSVEDIAHALSNICRFTGHTKTFYSVAQHSVIVSRLVPKPLALAALFHDASEAYICDVASPVKPYLTGYMAIERRIQEVIGIYLGINPDLFLHHEIKRADIIALATERRDLMPQNPVEWPILRGVAAMDEKIEAVGPVVAKEMFLGACKDLLAGSLAIMASKNLARRCGLAR